MLRRLVTVAKDEKVARLTADVLPENLEMQRVCEKLGFKLERSLEEAGVRAEMAL